MRENLSQIDAVRECRTLPVADVVTGKLDVREGAAALPEEVEEVQPLEEADGLDEGEESEVSEVEAAIEEAGR
jgi:type I restriction enzyme, S subunit